MTGFPLVLLMCFFATCLMQSHLGNHQDVQAPSVSLSLAFASVLDPLSSLSVASPETKPSLMASNTFLLDVATVARLSLDFCFLRHSAWFHCPSANQLKLHARCVYQRLCYARHNASQSVLGRSQVIACLTLSVLRAPSDCRPSNTSSAQAERIRRCAYSARLRSLPTPPAVLSVGHRSSSAPMLPSYLPIMLSYATHLTLELDSFIN